MHVTDALARVEISHLLSKYAICADQSNWDEMATVWAPDAVIIPPSGQLIEGKTAIMARFRSFRSATGLDKSGLTFARHCVTSSYIEFQSDSGATGLSYFQVITDSGLDHSGTYEDEFRKVGSQWLIAKRATRIDWVSSNTRFQFLERMLKSS